MTLEITHLIHLVEIISTLNMSTVEENIIQHVEKILNQITEYLRAILIFILNSFL